MTSQWWPHVGLDGPEQCTGCGKPSGREARHMVTYRCGACVRGDQVADQLAQLSALGQAADRLSLQLPPGVNVHVHVAEQAEPIATYVDGEQAAWVHVASGTRITSLAAAEALAEAGEAVVAWSSPRHSGSTNVTHWAGGPGDPGPIELRGGGGGSGYCETYTRCPGCGALHYETGARCAWCASGAPPSAYRGEPAPARRSPDLPPVIIRCQATPPPRRRRPRGTLATLGHAVGDVAEGAIVATWLGWALPLGIGWVHALHLTVLVLSAACILMTAAAVGGYGRDQGDRA